MGKWQAVMRHHGFHGRWLWLLILPSLLDETDAAQQHWMRKGALKESFVAATGAIMQEEPIARAVRGSAAAHKLFNEYFKDPGSLAASQLYSEYFKDDKKGNALTETKVSASNMAAEVVQRRRRRKKKKISDKIKKMAK